MTVRVLLFAGLRERLRSDSAALELPDGATVRDLLAARSPSSTRPCASCSRPAASPSTRSSSAPTTPSARATSWP
ncbi:hypothetical protein [Nannocystis sp.]|uniref:MoaD/ThiS family protein n=1 Tax=Nannocystis sp. TaxID=1962667 RepID=UPI0025FF63E3|nr:hypothetical protein [Nannocystis sp.]